MTTHATQEASDVGARVHPLREAMARVDESEAQRKAAVEIDNAVSAKGSEFHKALANRNSAMSDGLTMIARARQRVGGAPEIWTPHHAALAFNIIGLLLEAQGAPVVEVERAFLIPEGADEHTIHDALTEAVIKARRRPEGGGEPQKS